MGFKTNCFHGFGSGYYYHKDSVICPRLTRCVPWGLLTIKTSSPQTGSASQKPPSDENGDTSHPRHRYRDLFEIELTMLHNHEKLDILAVDKYY